LAAVSEGGCLIIIIYDIGRHSTRLTELGVTEKYLDIALLFADFLKESKECYFSAEAEKMERV
jgi:hypothetical protein